MHARMRMYVCVYVCVYVYVYVYVYMYVCMYVWPSGDFPVDQLHSPGSSPISPAIDRRII